MVEIVEADRLVRVYGSDVAFMMSVSYVATCAEMNPQEAKRHDISAGKYWDKADTVLAKMGENAFKVGIDLVLLEDSEDGKRWVFIQWLKGQGWSVLASASNEEKFRDLVRSERGEDVVGVLRKSVELPVQVREKKKLMFQVSDGYVKLTASAAALQLKGLPGEAGEVYGKAENGRSRRWGEG